MHKRTPLKSSPDSAKALGVHYVGLKLDNLQDSHSFKTRGLGYCILEALKENPSLRYIVSSSGGNAGLAATLVARELGLDVKVFVPITTPQDTRTLLESSGATVQVAGSVWDETHQEALKYLESLPSGTGYLVHPFEDDKGHIWEGHSSVIEEIKQDMGLPDVIVCSVGGGGLLGGILTGLLKHNEKKPIVIAVETEGAASFAASVNAGKLVTIPAITSIAKSLGAKTVSENVLKLRNLYGANLVRSLVVTDRQALDAVEQFHELQGYWVEPACGASLATIFVPGLLKSVAPECNSDSRVVVEVCGGFQVNQKLLDEWRQILI
jgi:L-serine/L-threonine ammonia-lyase